MTALSTLRPLSVIAATLVFASSALAQGVTGAGASFPAPVYAKWADAYNKATGTRINYQSVGSGAGIRQIKAKTVDFGASDAPLKDDERRVFPRREFHARVESQRLDHSIPARQNPHLSLSLKDLSLGGLSAISQTAVDAGERLAVYFPPLGTQRGWDAYGKVLRCEPSSFGYRLAVEFDPLPAAA